MTILEMYCQKLFGKWKTEKVKKDDGTVEEKEVYVPSKYTQEIQNAEVLQDAKEKETSLINLALMQLRT